jgi:hypothetical protein
VKVGLTISMMVLICIEIDVAIGGLKGGPVAGKLIYKKGVGIFKPSSKEERVDKSKYAASVLRQKRPDHYKDMQEKAKSVESREKRKSSLQKYHRERVSMGVSHHCCGTFWITNGVDNRKLKKDDPIPDGWTKGRKV